MSLFYKKLGKGEPLLMLHGLFCEGRNLLPLARKLSDTFEVYLVDLRNHGQSLYSDEMSYPLMAMDLQRLIMQLGFDKVHLLGHSMGGKTAMEFSTIWPEKLSSLIILDVAPVEYPPHHNNTFSALLDVDLSVTNTRTKIAEQLSQKISDHRLVNFFARNTVADESGVLKWRFNLSSLYKNYSSIQSAVGLGKQPYEEKVLMIKGGLSDYINRNYQDDILHLLPNVQVKVVQNVGHWLHAEKPDTLATVIRKYIEESKEIAFS